MIVPCVFPGVFRACSHSVYIIFLPSSFSIDDIEEEQKQRHKRATEEFKKQQESSNRDLIFNKKRQDELQAELNGLKDKEKEIKDNKFFQTEVQQRAVQVCFTLFLCYCFIFKV